MRRRTGLRNRFRNGRGTYSKQHKGRYRDRYGKWENGKLNSVENIAGHAISK